MARIAYKGGMADAFDKVQVVVDEVEVRLARPDERRRWDALMDQHHYLGFRQFAGRGLRHVAVWFGHWLALLGWQSGAFNGAPRGRWLGWHRSMQFRRLHLIGNNTRLVDRFGDRPVRASDGPAVHPVEEPPGPLVVGQQDASRSVDPSVEGGAQHRLDICDDDERIRTPLPPRPMIIQKPPPPCGPHTFWCSLS